MSMTLDQVLEILRANREMLRARGVMHAAVFGSVARGEARPDSDVDVIVDIDPDKHISILDFVGIRHALEDVIGTKVDLSQEKTMKRLVKENAMSEKFDAF